MSIQRVFLGWDEPCLPQAARWLCDRYGRRGSCDLSGVIVATPGARAGRRLLELLVDQGSEVALAPPTIVTTGQLPERLYTPRAPVADPLRVLLARVRALRLADHDALERVCTHRPAEDDLTAWLALAQELNALHEELAGEALSFGQVLGRCDTMPDFPEQTRWQALAELQNDYERVLAKHGLDDVHAARMAAVDEHHCQLDADLVLIAAADLGRITRLMLEQVGAQVTALVHAPAEEADQFDALGCVRVDRWLDRNLELDKSQLSVVDRPVDQAYEALRTIAEARSSQGEAVSADDITIGLGDQSLAPAIQRTLGLAQLPTRLATGRAMSQSRPAMLLAALARFVEGRRFDEFAALVRHPDIERYVQHLHAASAGATSGGAALTVLDRYTSDHLQARVAQRWLGSDEKTHETLDRLSAAVTALLPEDAGQTKPLPAWSQPIARVLQLIYGRDTLHRSDRDQANLIQGLEAIITLLREQAELDPESTLTPRVHLAEALRLMLARLSNSVAEPEGGGSAIELLGWLELQLDDAPVLIVTGVNEGLVPQSVTSDAFLPDHFRRALGLTDNRRRYARDLMMLEAILHSRPIVKLISGRRSASGDPLVPSRLTLACADERLAGWVGTFYDSHAGVTTSAPLLLQPGSRSGFVMPTPQPPAEPITSLPVTAFAAYLACPYRFYLKHVLKLREVDDAAVELDGATFGSLAHRVLSTFGQADVRDATDPQEIAAFLSNTLDTLIATRFGAEPRAAVRIQQEQLRRRLGALAVWEAQRSEAGWRIAPEWIELDAKAELCVDDQPLTITGRIDRIDSHPELGFRIIDYKTGDTAKEPEQTHRTGPRDNRQWRDLQLPLYHTLARAIGVAGPIELGYVILPKDLSAVGFAAAGWSDQQIDDAHSKAHEVVRSIRGGVFWPPADPPRYDDGLAGICMDQCSDRAEVITWQTEALGPKGGV